MDTIPENARTASVFLKISKSDLEASKCLFAGKFYCQSVFYLEQSIEKALKSLEIRFGAITEEEAKSKSIGHKAYMSQFLVDKKLEEYIADLKRRSRPEEESIITEMERVRKVTSQEQPLYEFKEVTKSPSIEELQEIISSMEVFRIIYGNGYIWYRISLNMLSVILEPHATKSRYKDGAFNPLEFYNGDLPLIQVFDRLVGITEQILYGLENLYTQLPKNF